MPKNEIVTYPKFVDACEQIAKRIDRNCITFRHIKSIYGIKRGGYVPAVYLSHLLDLPIAGAPDKCSLIVDDISDSGETLIPYKNAGYTIATIYYYRKSIVRPDIWVYEKKDKWIQFPWEVK